MERGERIQNENIIIISGRRPSSKLNSSQLRDDQTQIVHSATLIVLREQRNRVMQMLTKREATSCQNKTRLPSVEIPKEHNNRHTGIRKCGSQLMMRCSVSRADDDDDDDDDDDGVRTEYLRKEYLWVFVP